MNTLNNVQETSKHQYFIGESNGKRGCKKELIINYMRQRATWLTRREISVALKIDTATVSGLIRPLVMNKTVIEIENRTLLPNCPITNQPSNRIILREIKEKIDEKNRNQKSLF